MSRVDNNRLWFGAGLALLGLLTIVVTDRLILTPSHILFFNNVDRWLVGVVQIVAAAILLLPVVRPRYKSYDMVTLFPYLLICVMWAAVAYYPYTDGKVGNIISVVAWALVAVGIVRGCSYSRPVAS